MGLVACPVCDRHVRRTESSCPFCGSDVAEAIRSAEERPVVAMRLSRAAMVALAATGTGALSIACGTAGQPLYGCPAVMCSAGGTPSSPANGAGGLLDMSNAGGGASGAGGSNSVGAGGTHLGGAAGAIAGGAAGATNGGASSTGGSSTAGGHAGSAVDAGDDGSTGGALGAGGHSSPAPLYGLPAPRP